MLRSSFPVLFVGNRINNFALNCQFRASQKASWSMQTAQFPVNALHAGNYRWRLVDRRLVAPPTPSKISQFCGIFLAVIHFRALSRSHPRRCPPGAARTTRSTNLSGPLLRPCMFIAHEPQKPLPEFEVGVRNVLHGIPFGGRALVRLVSTLSHRRRASMSFSGHSAGTAAAPVRGSSILPRGLRSFMMKSHPISSEPTENTISPGMRIHCQKRYWL